MNERELRKAIIEHPACMRGLMLSSNAARLMKLTQKEKIMDSSELSVIKEISVQNASRQLYALFVKGYLKRTEVTSETGGISYIYESTV